MTALFPALIGDFFGRLAVGAIVGFIFALAGSPAAFGPLIAGYLYDATHSYREAFELSAALNLIAFAMVSWLKKPQRKRPPCSDDRADDVLVQQSWKLPTSLRQGRISSFDWTARITVSAPAVALMIAVAV